MLTACGEGFEATKIEGLTSEPDQAVESEINERPAGETPPEVDQSIYDSFANEINGLDLATVLAFVFDIKAFGLELQTVEHPGGASTNTSATSLLLRGCATNQRTEIYSSSISYQSLLAGERIVAGNNGLYEVLLECTLNDCSEMMAIIRRQGDDTTDAIAFIGLEKDGSDVVSGNKTTSNYISRRVQINSDTTRAALEPMSFLINHCSGSGGGSNTVVNPLGDDEAFAGEDEGFNWYDPVGEGESL